MAKVEFWKPESHSFDGTIDFLLKEKKMLQEELRSFQALASSHADTIIKLQDEKAELRDDIRRLTREVDFLIEEKEYYLAEALRFEELFAEMNIHVEWRDKP
jgi:hypothetical protein